MFNRKLKRQVEALRIEVSDLRRGLEYYPKASSSLPCYYTSHFGHVQPVILTASNTVRRLDEIRDQFQELYEHLGVTRKFVPETPATNQLVKEEKNGK